MGRTVTVFLEKDGTRKEVEVTKRIEGEIEKVWLKEKDAHPQQEERKENHEPTLEDDERTKEEDDEPTPEDVGMQQDTPDEIEAMNKMWLAESHITRERE